MVDLLVGITTGCWVERVILLGQEAGESFFGCKVFFPEL